MIRSDDENLILANSTSDVDELNADFYGRFPYPWRPAEFNFLLDADFETDMLNQSLGDWEHRVLPKRPEIWVAGCGTNQAVITALKFPHATVLGSDLSSPSLKLAATSARELQLSNLELKNESINRADYTERFDYVICTGVIHHNARPTAALEKLAAALKPTGVLELMVYNRYHRIITTAFQKAIRMLSGNSSADGFELEMTLTRRIMDNFPAQNLVSILLHEHRDSPEAALADSLLQPVEHSYTVESLEMLAAECGLEILMPCINRYDRATRSFSWNMEFGDRLVQEHFDALPDLSRWQVANLLLLEKSPGLWFYLQRKDSGRQRKTERDVCAEFLDTIFVRATSQQGRYVQSSDGTYELLPRTIDFPRPHADRLLGKIIDSVNGAIVMRDILKRLEIDLTFQKVNQIRLALTTSTSPYLLAVKDEKMERQEQEEKARELKQVNLQKFRTIKRKSVGLP